MAGDIHYTLFSSIRRVTSVMTEFALGAGHRGRTVRRLLNAIEQPQPKLQPLREQNRQHVVSSVYCIPLEPHTLRHELVVCRSRRPALSDKRMQASDKPLNKARLQSLFAQTGRPRRGSRVASLQRALIRGIPLAEPPFLQHAPACRPCRYE